MAGKVVANDLDLSGLFSIGIPERASFLSLEPLAAVLYKALSPTTAAAWCSKNLLW